MYKVVGDRLQKNESLMSMGGLAQTNLSDIPDGLLGKAGALNGFFGNMKTNGVGIGIGAGRRLYPNTDYMVCLGKAKC
jgi:hypothetical protein